MDNNQKLDFIVRLERKQKIKRIAMLVGVLLFFGALMIYFQVMNFENVEKPNVEKP